MAGDVPQEGPLGIARVFPVFSIVFAAVYFFGVYTELGPIRYYPLINEVHVTPQPTASGPAMLWYGWLINGTVAGGVVSALALLIPREMAESLCRRFAWTAIAFSVVLFVVFTIFLRHYFVS